MSGTSIQVKHKISYDAICYMYPAFAEQVKEKLRRGAEEYGDQSFSRDPLDLLHEVRQELLDVCGWSFILWCRIYKLEEMIKERYKDAK